MYVAFFSLFCPAKAQKKDVLSIIVFVLFLILIYPSPSASDCNLATQEDIINQIDFFLNTSFSNLFVFYLFLFIYYTINKNKKGL